MLFLEVDESANTFTEEKKKRAVQKHKHLTKLNFSYQTVCLPTNNICNNLKKKRQFFWDKAVLQKL